MAAYRMAEDPSLPLTDVQYVLGHALAVIMSSLGVSTA